MKTMRPSSVWAITPTPIASRIDVRKSSSSRQSADEFAPSCVAPESGSTWLAIWLSPRTSNVVDSPLCSAPRGAPLIGIGNSPRFVSSLCERTSMCLLSGGARAALPPCPETCFGYTSSVRSTTPPCSWRSSCSTPASSARTPTPSARRWRTAHCEWDVDAFLALDEERRTLIAEVEALQAQRNEASKAIGALMKDGKRDEAEAAKEEVRRINERIAGLEAHAGRGRGRRARPADDRAQPPGRDRAGRRRRDRQRRGHAAGARRRSSTSSRRRTGTSAPRSASSTSSAR